MYEEAFLHCSDLKYLEGGERRFIIAHLLPRLRGPSLSKLIPVLEGIGGFLTVEEVEPLTIKLFAAVLGDYLVAKSRLYSEYDLMEPEIKSKIHQTIAAFKDWPYDKTFLELCDEVLGEFKIRDIDVPF